jgi:hypothetical protein
VHVRKGEGDEDKCGSKRVPVGAFSATCIPSTHAADSPVVVYVAGAHEFNSPVVSKILPAHKFDMRWRYQLRWAVLARVGLLAFIPGEQ